MLSLFTIPKPFAGHIGIIQRNALRSWRELGGDVRVALLGDEPGTADAARELGFTHLPELARNHHKTPLLGDAFERATRWSDHRVFCYINADIILTGDFRAACERVARRMRRFLMVGQRWDIRIDEPIDFSPGWDTTLSQRVRSEGRQHRPTAIDYFVHTRGALDPIPPFAIGRFTWDNWMIYRARSVMLPVIDATAVVTAIHQNHDYAHAGGFKRAFTGPEARANLALAGGVKHLYTIWDATHILTPNGLQTRPPTAPLGGGIWSYRRSVRLGV